LTGGVLSNNGASRSGAMGTNCSPELRVGGCPSHPIAAQRSPKLRRSRGTHCSQYPHPAVFKSQSQLLVFLFADERWDPSMSQPCVNIICVQLIDRENLSSLDSGILPCCLVCPRAAWPRNEFWGEGDEMTHLHFNQYERCSPSA